MAVPALTEAWTWSLQVLTDLDDEWDAMWLDGSTIYQHIFASRGPAVAFIRDLLAGRFKTCKDISQTSFAERRQIDDRLCGDFAAAFARKLRTLMSPHPQ